MFNLAAASSGARVLLASSSDETRSPENIIDGQPETYWTSTGMYPQEFVISFPDLKTVNSIRIQSSGIQHMAIHRSVKAEPIEFEPLDSKDIPNEDGQLQEAMFDVSDSPARHLKFCITKGYDYFITVHHIHVHGNAAS